MISVYTRMISLYTRMIGLYTLRHRRSANMKIKDDFYSHFCKAKWIFLDHSSSKCKCVQAWKSSKPSQFFMQVWLMTANYWELRKKNSPTVNNKFPIKDQLNILMLYFLHRAVNKNKLLKPKSSQEMNIIMKMSFYNCIFCGDFIANNVSRLWWKIFTKQNL